MGRKNHFLITRSFVVMALVVDSEVLKGRLLI